MIMFNHSVWRLTSVCGHSCIKRLKQNFVCNTSQTSRAVPSVLSISYHGNMRQSFSVCRQKNDSASQVDSVNYRYLSSKKPKRISEDFSSQVKETWNVVAYACAKELDLEAAATGVGEQGLYHSTDVLPDDVGDALHFTANYKLDSEPREVFLFREGAAIFWNVPEIERLSVLQFLKKYGDTPYDDTLVHDENEVFEFSYTTLVTSLRKGKIYLNTDGQITLEKYTFSNALALSVKLAIWETSLDKFAEGIESIAEDLKGGTPIKQSRQQVLRKMGELFMLSHMINLSSDLLDTPDFYWERDELEPLYHKMCHYLNIAKRTKVMNEKINLCSELLQLIKDHLNDQHHVRLEIMIIILIMIEVVFELIHWYS